MSSSVLKVLVWEHLLIFSALVSQKTVLLLAMVLASGDGNDLGHELLLRWERLSLLE